MNADEYNLRELAAGRITPLHITQLTRLFQAGHDGLTVDGKLGPATREELFGGEAPPDPQPLIVDSSGWLVGDGVIRMPAHVSWFPIQKARDERKAHSGGDALTPRAIVFHYTATGKNADGKEADTVKPGTAHSMAKRRMVPLSEEDRVASWHVTIETDGKIYQMIPFIHGAWHVRQSCPPIPGAGKASLSAIGVELVGWGKSFTDAQVTAAKRLGRALVRKYHNVGGNPGITPERFGVTHQELDPTRRNDPGPVWQALYAREVQEYAYGG